MKNPADKIFVSAKAGERRKQPTHKFSNKRARKRLTRTTTSSRKRVALKLTQVLTAEDLRIAVWYYVDGFELAEIGEWLGEASKQAVNRRLNRIEEKLVKARIPLPKRLEHPYVTDHVDNFNLLE